MTMNKTVSALCGLLLTLSFASVSFAKTDNWRKQGFLLHSAAVDKLADQLISTLKQSSSAETHESAKVFASMADEIISKSDDEEATVLALQDVLRSKLEENKAGLEPKRIKSQLIIIERAVEDTFRFSGGDVWTYVGIGAAIGTVAAVAGLKVVTRTTGVQIGKWAIAAAAIQGGVYGGAIRYFFGDSFDEKLNASLRSIVEGELLQ